MPRCEQGGGEGFPERFHHVPQLNKMGARISLRGNTATIHGVRRLWRYGARHRLKGGSSPGAGRFSRASETYVSDIKHIERGYENIHLALNSLGARIERVALHLKGWRGSDGKTALSFAPCWGQALCPVECILVCVAERGRLLFMPRPERRCSRKNNNIKGNN